MNNFFPEFFHSHSHTQKVWPFDLLFFAQLGQTRVEQVKVDKIDTAIELRQQPPQVDWLYEILFGTYLLVTIVTLRKLLTTMLTDTYQRIQART